jgi:hypothetical protein
MVGESYEGSVFYKNINPIRTGLMIYHLVDDLHYHCDTADGVTTNLKETIKEKLIAVVEIYKDADAVIPLFEQTDFEGQNCYYYLLKFELSEILNCPILEQTIEEKWSGRTQVSSSMFDYSTPWTLFKDEFKLFSFDKMLVNLKETIFKKNAERMTHVGQYHVWKRSMKFRFMLEALYTLAMTCLFQFYVSDFNKRLHIGSDDLIKLDIYKLTGKLPEKEGAEGAKENEELKEEYYQDIQFMLYDFNVIFYLSVPYYLFPVHYLFRVFFEFMTKRSDASTLTPLHYCELGCFLVLFFWEQEKKRLTNTPINTLDLDENFNSEQ